MDSPMDGCATSSAEIWTRSGIRQSSENPSQNQRLQDLDISYVEETKGAGVLHFVGNLAGYGKLVESRLNVRGQCIF